MFGLPPPSLHSVVCAIRLSSHGSSPPSIFSFCPSVLQREDAVSVDGMDSRNVTAIACSLGRNVALAGELAVHRRIDPSSSIASLPHIFLSICPLVSRG